MWRMISDFPNYEVSDIGEVRNIKTGRRLAPKRSKTGYLRVTLCNDGFQKTMGIHRLVAIAFIPNPENKPTVNHKNEVKDDNRVENLEWATIEEQNIYGTRLKRAREHTDYKLRNQKMDYYAIAEKHDYNRPDMCGRCSVAVYKDGIFISIFKSQAEASRYTNVSQPRISACVNGEIESAKGYVFRREIR